MHQFANCLGLGIGGSCSIGEVTAKKNTPRPTVGIREFGIRPEILFSGV